MNATTTNQVRSLGAAYDYEKARWVMGAEAQLLRVAQIREELVVLESARGSQYLSFLGMRESLPAAIAKCRAMLRVCEACFGPGEGRGVNVNANAEEILT